MIARALVRFMRRTPASTLTALLGVTLGISSIVSVHLVSASVDRQLGELVLAPLSGYTHFVHADALSASDYFALRAAWRRGELEDVAAIAPIIDESALLGGERVRLLGVDLIGALADGTDGLTGTLELDQQRDFSWQGVWVDASLQALPGIQINGVVEAPAGTVIADIGAAQRLLGWSSHQISYIALKQRRPLAGAIDAADAMLPGFSAGVPWPEYELPDAFAWRVLAAADQHPAARFGRAVLFNVSALSLLALLVAWFVIYQVSVSWVRRLWPVFVRLHAAGVQWAALQGWFVAVMGGLGLLGGVLGLVAGQQLARGLHLWADSADFFDAGLDGWIVGKAIGGALVVCCLGGWWAMSRARGLVAPARGRWLAAVLAAIVIVVGARHEASGLAGGFVAIGLLSGVVLLFVQPVLGMLRSYSRYLKGPLLVRLGLRESIWYPADLGIALSALSLAVAVAIGVGVMVDSFRVDFSAMLERRLSYDLVVQGEPEELALAHAYLVGREDVAYLQVYRDQQLRVRGLPVEVSFARYGARETARYGYTQSLSGQRVLISELTARNLGAGAGDTLDLPWGAVQVAGVFAGFGDVVPRILVDESNMPATGAVMTSLHVDAMQPGALARELTAAVDGVRVVSQDQLRRTALDVFDQTFAITTILIWIALLVAALGLFIAVTAMRLNRRAGHAMMQGLGVSRVEKLGVDFMLGTGLGCTAALLALPLGLGIAWLLCTVINPRGFGWSIHMQLSLGSLLQPLAWGVLAAMAAGVLRVGQAEEGLHGRAA